MHLFAHSTVRPPKRAHLAELGVPTLVVEEHVDVAHDDVRRGLRLVDRPQRDDDGRVVVQAVLTHLDALDADAPQRAPLPVPTAGLREVRPASS